MGRRSFEVFQLKHDDGTRRREVILSVTVYSFNRSTRCEALFTSRLFIRKWSAYIDEREVVSAIESSVIFSRIVPSALLHPFLSLSLSLSFSVSLSPWNLALWKLERNLRDTANIVVAFNGLSSTLNPSGLHTFTVRRYGRSSEKDRKVMAIFKCVPIGQRSYFCGR